jgi:hypothetical protein
VKRLEESAVFEALFDSAPVGMAIWDRELRYRHINAQLAEINGLPAEAHLGCTPSELLGELGLRVEAALRAVFDADAPVTELPFAGETPAAPGVRRHWQAGFYPVGECVGGIVLEVTSNVLLAEREAEALEEATAAAEALARAGTALTTSMRPDRLLAELLRAVVPALADLCAVHLVRGDGELELIAAAHADPALEDKVRELGAIGAESTRAAAEVVRTGSRRVFPDLEGASLPIIDELGVRSAVMHPLSARGAMLGALTLAMGPSDRSYDPALIELTGSLAAGAALALDNSRLFAEQREVARAVQRTLLPAELPAVPGAELAARYRAAGRSIQAGGDFYDVFAAGDEWAFAIGDVVGKGAEAAAITAVVRATLQAAVLHGDDAEAALRLADEALRRRPAGQFCSAIHGRIRSRDDGSGLDVELLVAGHPPPLVLRADGALEVVSASGTLLGVSPDAVFGRANIRLQPGDALVLYTDGATELRGEDRFRGEQVLRDTVLGTAGQPLSRTVEAIEHQALVLGGGELRDDLAVLAVGAVRSNDQ